MSGIDIEYLEEFADLILPSTSGGVARARSAAPVQQNDDEDSSSIDQDLFESLFDDNSNGDLIDASVDPKLCAGIDRQGSMDELDLLVKDLADLETPAMPPLTAPSRQSLPPSAASFHPHTTPQPASPTKRAPISTAAANDNNKHGDGGAKKKATSVRTATYVSYNASTPKRKRKSGTSRSSATTNSSKSCVAAKPSGGGPSLSASSSSSSLSSAPSSPSPSSSPSSPTYNAFRGTVKRGRPSGRSRQQRMVPLAIRKEPVRSRPVPLNTRRGSKSAAPPIIVPTAAERKELPPMPAAASVKTAPKRGSSSRGRGTGRPRGRPPKFPRSTTIFKPEKPSKQEKREDPLARAPPAVVQHKPTTAYAAKRDDFRDVEVDDDSDIVSLSDISDETYMSLDDLNDVDLDTSEPDMILDISNDSNTTRKFAMELEKLRRPTPSPTVSDDSKMTAIVSAAKSSPSILAYVKTATARRTQQPVPNAPEEVRRADDSESVSETMKRLPLHATIISDTLLTHVDKIVNMPPQSEAAAATKSSPSATPGATATVNAGQPINITIMEMSSSRQAPPQTDLKPAAADAPADGGEEKRANRDNTELHAAELPQSGLPVVNGAQAVTDSTEKQSTVAGSAVEHSNVVDVSVDVVVSTSKASHAATSASEAPQAAASAPEAPPAKRDGLESAAMQTAAVEMEKDAVDKSKEARQESSQKLVNLEQTELVDMAAVVEISSAPPEEDATQPKELDVEAQAESPSPDVAAWQEQPSADAAIPPESPLKDIAAPPESLLKDGDAPPESPLKDVSAPPESPLKDVAAPPESPLKDVACPTESLLKGVSAPPELPSPSTAVRTETPLMDVAAPPELPSPSPEKVASAADATSPGDNAESAPTGTILDDSDVLPHGAGMADETLTLLAGQTQPKDTSARAVSEKDSIETPMNAASEEEAEESTSAATTTTPDDELLSPTVDVVDKAEGSPIADEGDTIPSAAWDDGDNDGEQATQDGSTPSKDTTYGVEQSQPATIVGAKPTSNAANAIKNAAADTTTTTHTTTKTTSTAATTTRATISVATTTATRTTATPTTSVTKAKASATPTAASATATTASPTKTTSAAATTTRATISVATTTPTRATATPTTSATKTKASATTTTASATATTASPPKTTASATVTTASPTKTTSAASTTTRAMISVATTTPTRATATPTTSATKTKASAATITASATATTASPPKTTSAVSTTTRATISVATTTATRATATPTTSATKTKASATTALPTATTASPTKTKSAAATTTRATISVATTPTTSATKTKASATTTAASVTATTASPTKTTASATATTASPTKTAASATATTASPTKTTSSATATTASPTKTAASATATTASPTKITASATATTASATATTTSPTKTAASATATTASPTKITASATATTASPTKTTASATATKASPTKATTASTITTTTTAATTTATAATTTATAATTTATAATTTTTAATTTATTNVRKMVDDAPTAASVAKRAKLESPCERAMDSSEKSEHESEHGHEYDSLEPRRVVGGGAAKDVRERDKIEPRVYSRSSKALALDAALAAARAAPPVEPLTIHQRRRRRPRKDNADSSGDGDSICNNKRLKSQPTAASGRGQDAMMDLIAAVEEAKMSLKEGNKSAGSTRETTPNSTTTTATVTSTITSATLASAIATATLATSTTATTTSVTPTATSALAKARRWVRLKAAEGAADEAAAPPTTGAALPTKLPTAPRRTQVDVEMANERKNAAATTPQTIMAPPDVRHRRKTPSSSSESSETPKGRALKRPRDPEPDVDTAHSEVGGSQDTAAGTGNPATVTPTPNTSRRSGGRPPKIARRGLSATPTSPAAAPVVGPTEITPLTKAADAAEQLPTAAVKQLAKSPAEPTSVEDLPSFKIPKVLQRSVATEPSPSPSPSPAPVQQPTIMTRRSYMDQQTAKTPPQAEPKTTRRDARPHAALVSQFKCRGVRVRMNRASVPHYWKRIELAKQPPVPQPGCSTARDAGPPEATATAQKTPPSADKVVVEPTRSSVPTIAAVPTAISAAVTTRRSGAQLAKDAKPQQSGATVTSPIVTTRRSAAASGAAGATKGNGAAAATATASAEVATPPSAIRPTALLSAASLRQTSASRVGNASTSTNMGGSGENADNEVGQKAATAPETTSLFVRLPRPPASPPKASVVVPTTVVGRPSILTIPPEHRRATQASVPTKPASVTAIGCATPPAPSAAMPPSPPRTAPTTKVVATTILATTTTTTAAAVGTTLAPSLPPMAACAPAASVLQQAAAPPTFMPVEPKTEVIEPDETTTTSGTGGAPGATAVGALQPPPAQPAPLSANGTELRPVRRFEVEPTSTVTSQTQSLMASSSLPSTSTSELNAAPAASPAFGGSHNYTFLHPSKYNRSHGSVLLDYCCPNLDGPMPAVNASRVHGRVQSHVVALPETIVMTTSIVTAAQMAANPDRIPAAIRQKVERLASSKAQATAARATAAAGTQPLSKLHQLQLQLPRNTSITEKLVSPMAAQAAKDPPAGGEPAQLRIQLRRFDALIKKYSDQLAPLLSFEERQRASERIMQTTRFSSRDMETAVRVLDEYVLHMGMISAVAPLAISTIQPPQPATRTMQSPQVQSPLAAKPQPVPRTTQSPLVQSPLLTKPQPVPRTMQSPQVPSPLSTKPLQATAAPITAAAPSPMTSKQPQPQITAKPQPLPQIPMVQITTAAQATPPPVKVMVKATLKAPATPLLVKAPATPHPVKAPATPLPVKTPATPLPVKAPATPLLDKAPARNSPLPKKVPGRNSLPPTKAAARNSLPPTKAAARNSLLPNKPAAHNSPPKRSPNPRRLQQQHLKQQQLLLQQQQEQEREQKRQEKQKRRIEKQKQQQEEPKPQKPQKQHKQQQKQPKEEQETRRSSAQVVRPTNKQANIPIYDGERRIIGYHVKVPTKTATKTPTGSAATPSPQVPAARATRRTSTPIASDNTPTSSNARAAQIAPRLGREISVRMLDSGTPSPRPGAAGASKAKQATAPKAGKTLPRTPKNAQPQLQPQPSAKTNTTTRATTTSTTTMATGTTTVRPPSRMTRKSAAAAAAIAVKVHDVPNSSPPDECILPDSDNPVAPIKDEREDDDFIGAN